MPSISWCCCLSLSCIIFRLLSHLSPPLFLFFFFFFNDPAPTDISPLPLPAPLPIYKTSIAGVSLLCPRHSPAHIMRFARVLVSTKSRRPVNDNTFASRDLLPFRLMHRDTQVRSQRVSGFLYSAR